MIAPAKHWLSAVRRIRADLRGIRRVLKPGGRVVIIAETYKGIDVERGKGWICCVGRYGPDRAFG